MPARAKSRSAASPTRRGDKRFTRRYRDKAANDCAATGRRGTRHRALAYSGAPPPIRNLSKPIRPGWSGRVARNPVDHGVDLGDHKLGRSEITSSGAAFCTVWPTPGNTISFAVAEHRLCHLTVTDIFTDGCMLHRTL